LEADSRFQSAYRSDSEDIRRARNKLLCADFKEPDLFVLIREIKPGFVQRYKIFPALALD
jgi:hypothetical protein